MFQYRFDPQTGAWEHKQFKKEEGEALFSLHDISYNEAGMVINNSITCRDFKGTLDVSIYLWQIAPGHFSRVVVSFC